LSVDELRTFFRGVSIPTVADRPRPRPDGESDPIALKSIPISSVFNSFRMQLKGSCLCGKVTYTVNVTDPVTAHFCYCSHCRKSSASLLDACLIIPKDEFHVIDGQELLTEYAIKADSGADVVRVFCKECGTRICGKSNNPRDLKEFDGRGAMTAPIGPLDVSVDDIKKWERGEEWFQDQRALMKLD
jgi:hypothetical protein